MQIFIFLIFLVLLSLVPVEKVVIDEEELHSIKIDGILNLENIYLEQCLSIKNNGI